MSRYVSDLARKVRLPFRKRRTAAKAVLLSLADDCRDDGSCAFPSMTTIGLEAAICIKTGDQCLVDLQQVGLICEQAPPAQRRPRTWRINVERMRELVDPQDLQRVDDAWPGPSARYTGADLAPIQFGKVEPLDRQIANPDRQIEAPARRTTADERKNGVRTEGKNLAASPPPDVLQPVLKGRRAANAALRLRRRTA